MKLKCKKDDLKNKLSITERVTGKNMSLPILGSILFNAKNRQLILKATNLEVGVEVTLPASVEKNGIIAVPGRIVSNFLNSLPDEEIVTLEQINGNLSIHTKNNSALIKTHKPDDFPVIPRINSNNILKINSKDFINGLKSVLFSTSTSDIKPEIASVCVYSDNNNIIFAATDSFRLAEKMVKQKEVHIDKILIPYKNAAEIVKFFEDGDIDIKLIFDKTQLSVESNNMYLTTRLTDGVYPNYKQIIPTKFKTQATVLRNEIINLLKTSNVFLDDFNRVSIKIIPEDNIIEVESKNSDVGENTSRTDAHTEGDNVEMGFNYRYISEVFGIINTDSVSLKFNESHKPMVISGVGDQTFIYLIMPVTR